ncbi:MAG: FAD-dependent oxidoreductase, partial [Leptothrix sp. (in: b-proteobacteria)]
ASGLAPGAVRRLQAALVQAGVRVDLNTPYTDAIGQACDLLLWAPGAAAHRWPADSGLAVDAQGFIRIDAQLRSVSHPAIHAVGDCAAWGADALDPSALGAARPLPKAGVFAVRMGPVLSANLRAALGHGAAIRYTPQRRHLVLLATGDGRAIASWGRWSAGGAVVGRALWRWKDRIDQAFLARFRLQQGASPSPSLPASDPPSP